MDSRIYKDPIPKTIASFRRRLHFAWPRVSHETLQNLMPGGLKNFIKRNVDILDTNLRKNERISILKIKCQLKIKCLRTYLTPCM